MFDKIHKRYCNRVQPEVGWMCFREQCPTGSQAQGLDRHEREPFQQQKLERPGFDLD